MSDTEVRYLESVPVGELCKGLYVAELDRPWSEVPVTFQGFELATDEELAILREHCEVVFIERARSQPAALEALDRLEEPAQQPSHPDARLRRDITAALGRGRTPEKDGFAALVQSAAKRRREAEDSLDRAMHDARLGHSIDSREVRETVTTLAREVAENASAQLWLTNLREKDGGATAGHSINVCVLALAFGKFVGIDDDQLEHIAFGALLHDVGNVRVPGEILRKAGSLTEEEWRLVKQHPEHGHAILVESGDVPQEALDIVLLHHERVGGVGYPYGLRRNDLSRHVRLVGIADAYDSLTSERPYRMPQPADAALSTLYNESDVLFGPKLTQAFIRCIGIYPVGSLVELDNGALGIVLGTSPESRLQPTVLLVRTPEGEDYDKRVLLNLAEDPGAGGTRRTVRHVVGAAEHGIDVPGIVAFEFGITL